MTRPRKTLTELQDEFVETVNAGIARWSHRHKLQWQVGGGHANRIYHGAVSKLKGGLEKWDYTPDQIEACTKDARDMAELVRLSDVAE
jgi:hypothetical protein